MRVLWRVALVLVTFLAFGFATAHLLVARAVLRGAPEYSVRLAGAVGGLFAGGAAATLVTLALLLGRRGKPSNADQDASQGS